VDNIEYENIENLALKKWLKSGELNFGMSAPGRVRLG